MYHTSHSFAFTNQWDSLLFCPWGFLGRESVFLAYLQLAFIFIVGKCSQFHFCQLLKILISLADVMINVNKMEHCKTQSTWVCLKGLAGTLGLSVWIKFPKSWRGHKSFCHCTLKSWWLGIKEQPPLNKHSNCHMFSQGLRRLYLGSHVSCTLLSSCTNNLNRLCYFTLSVSAADDVNDGYFVSCCNCGAIFELSLPQLPSPFQLAYHFLPALKKWNSDNHNLDNIRKQCSVLQLTSGGRPHYYVSYRRSAFAQMKLPKYALPKVNCYAWNLFFFYKCTFRSQFDQALQLLNGICRTGLINIIYPIPFKQNCSHTKKIDSMRSMFQLAKDVHSKYRLIFRLEEITNYYFFLIINDILGFSLKMSPSFLCVGAFHVLLH